MEVTPDRTWQYYSAENKPVKLKIGCIVLGSLKKIFYAAIFFVIRILNSYVYRNRRSSKYFF